MSMLVHFRVLVMAARSRVDEVPLVRVVGGAVFDEVEAFAARLALVLAAAFLDLDAAFQTGPAHGEGSGRRIYVMRAIGNNSKERVWACD